MQPILASYEAPFRSNLQKNTGPVVARARTGPVIQSSILFCTGPLIKDYISHLQNLIKFYLTFYKHVLFCGLNNQHVCIINAQNRLFCYSLLSLAPRLPIDYSKFNYSRKVCNCFFFRFRLFANNRRFFRIRIRLSKLFANGQ